METRTCKRHGEQLIDAYYKYVARTNSAGEPIYSYRCRLCAAESDAKRRERKRTGQKLEEKPRYFCSKHGQLTSDDFRKQKAFEYKGKPIYKDKCKLCEKEYREQPIAKEKVKRLVKKWIKENPEKKREYDQRWLDKPENRLRKKIWSREWGRKNPEKRRENNRRYFERHPEKREELKKRAQKRNQERRKTVLIHYSGDSPKCACCGESHLGFLCIDHVDGGGNKHRKKLNRKTHGFWRWLIEQNFPNGYRVLCHNCNFAIGAYDRCPHEDNR